MKTYHIPLIIQAVQWILVKKKTPGKALELLFKTYDVNVYDKRIVAENVYDIIRWWRLLTDVNNGNTSESDANLARVIGINLIRNGFSLPPHEWLKKLHPESIQKKLEQALKKDVVRHSLPDWLEKKGKEELGEKWEETMDALNMHYDTAIRVNTLSATKESIEQILDEEGITFTPTPLSDDGFILDRHADIFKLDIFKQGKIEVQDAGSQHVSVFAGVKPGMRVIDACAGAGGKTLHLAALMKNKGKIIAMDTQAYKLEELKKRYKRAGAENIEIKPIDNNKVIKRLQGSADVVLLDAPCSGLGVLKRNPDIRWKTHPREVEEIIGIQENILQQYSVMVKPGGALVYATCSIFPSENEMQVKKFLEKNPSFRLEEEKNISPAEFNADGFYMARLRKEMRNEELKIKNEEGSQ